MRKIILIIALLVLVSASESEAKKFHPGGHVTFEIFYYSLAPYGEWIEIDYGLYAWRPIRIKYNWSPYLYGRWVWTRYGWYWDSFEPFGWAVYHYGRWYYDDYYGWIWIPDYTWGPAWVEWRYTDRYVGWAPLPPYAGFSISIGIHFSVNWISSVHYWHFVPINYFCGYEVHKYIVPSKYKYRVYNESRHSIKYRYENERLINEGIDRNFVERYAGRIRELPVEESTRLRDISVDRSNDKVRIFRPNENEIKRNGEINIKRAERKVEMNIDRVITPRERFEFRKVERDEKNNDRLDRIGRRNFELNDRDVKIRKNPDEVRLRDSENPPKNINDIPTRSSREIFTPNDDRNKTTGDRDRRINSAPSYPKRQIEPNNSKPQNDYEFRKSNERKIESNSSRERTRDTAPRIESNRTRSIK